MMEISEIKIKMNKYCDLESEIEVGDIDVRVDDLIFVKKKYTFQHHENQQGDKFVSGNIRAQDKDIKVEVEEQDTTKIKEEEAEPSFSDMKTPEQNLKIKCLYCNIRIQHKQELEKHISDVHSGFPLEYNGGCIQCQFCKQFLDGLSVLIKHIQEDHRNKKLDDECDVNKPTERTILSQICKSENTVINNTSNVQCLNVTQEVPKTEKPHYTLHENRFTFKCQKCQQIFRSTLKEIYEHGLACNSSSPNVTLDVWKSCKLLLRKSKRAQNDNRPHECKVCNKRFRTGAGLKMHIEIHRPEANYKCNKCFKSFKGELLLRKHYKGFHSGPRSCDICGEIFPAQRPLSNHLYLHKKSIILNCHLCSKSFKRDLLSHHLTSVHNYPRETASKIVRQRTATFVTLKGYKLIT